jgi:hypothetical protein
LGFICLGAGALAAFASAPVAVGATQAHTVDIRITAAATYEARSDTPQATTAQGDLPVARSALGEAARSVIAIDAPAGAVSGRLTLPNSGRADESYGTPAISLCPVTVSWTPGSGQDITTAPSYDCSGVAAVSFTTPNWTFDLGPALARWRTGRPDLGVALVMDATSNLPEKATFNAVTSQVVGTAVLPDLSNPANELQPQPGSGDTTSSVDQTQPAGPGPAPVPAEALPAPATTEPNATAPLVATPAAPLRVSTVASITARRVASGVWMLVPGGLMLFLALARALSAAGRDGADGALS